MATYQLHRQFLPLFRIGNCLIWLEIAHHGDCQFKVFGIEVHMQIIVGQIEDLNAFSLTVQCAVVSVVNVLAESCMMGCCKDVK